MNVDGARVLVTGGCGFIGSHLVDALLARGAARVVVLDSMRCGDPGNLGERSAKIEIVRFTLGDGDRAALDEAVKGVDVLFHLAAEKHQASLDRPEELIRANVGGTYALLDAATRAGVKKAVFSSSLYAYGRMSGPPMREDELPQPATVYGMTKLAGEHLLAHFAKERGLAHTTLRYFFVYGPKQFAGQGYKSVIVKTSERLLDGQAPIVVGDGEQALDYVFVDDVVEATIRAAEIDAGGATLNIASGIATKVKDLIAALTAIAGRRVAPERAPADFTAGSSRSGDPSRAREILGFHPKTSLEEGLAKTFRWIAAHR